MQDWQRAAAAFGGKGRLSAALMFSGCLPPLPPSVRQMEGITVSEGRGGYGVGATLEPWAELESRKKVQLGQNIGAEFGGNCLCYLLREIARKRWFFDTFLRKV